MKLETNHTLAIEAFVEGEEIDSIWQDTPYYLAPDGKMAEETFIVLREAMARAGKVAIARLVLSSRERMVTVAPRDAGMYVCTLRAPNEVRATATYFDDIPDSKPDAEMLELAQALIKQKTTKFDPKAYEDRYEAALMTMIKEKLKGHKPIIAAEPARGNVVNLMDALKQSLGQSKPPAASRSKKAAPAEEAAPKAAASGGRRRAPAKRRRPDRSHPVTDLAPVFGIVGALAAFPRRLAARAVEARGATLRRGTSRQTTHVVLGRKLLARTPEAEIEARVAAERAAGRTLLSETGFLRLLGLADRQPTSGISRRTLVDAGLTEAELDLLTLFDAFEHDAEPWSFRDLILARKYAALRREGASWSAIARSVHRFGPAGGLTAATLAVGPCRGVLVGDAEPDGQLRLDLGAAERPRGPLRRRRGRRGRGPARRGRRPLPPLPGARPRRRARRLQPRQRAQRPRPARGGRTATTCAPPASTAASPRPSSTSAASPATAATAPPPAATSPAPSPSTPTMPTPSTTSRRSSSTPATSTPPARTGGAI